MQLHLPTPQQTQAGRAQQRLAGSAARWPAQRGRHAWCRAAAGAAAEPSVQKGAAASGSAEPSSWPSAAARAAAYGKVSIDEVEGLAATVTGRLPAWLRGAYLRNGPGDYTGMKHMFDGFSLIAKLELDGAANTVTASHRFLQSAAYQHFKQTGRLKWREFGTARPHDSPLDAAADVAQTLLGVMGIGDGVTDNACVSLLPLPGGQALAMTETLPGTYLLDVGSLDTLERLRYKDGISGDITTAHPTVLRNGDLINFVSTVRMNHWVGGGFTLYRQRLGNLAQREVLAQVPPRRPFAPAWIHDFPSSQNYTVLPEMPLYFNLGLLLSGGENEHVFMDWKPEDGTMIHVVSHTDGQVRTYKTGAVFVFHWANAWESEDGRYLHIDGAAYEDARILGDLYLDPLKAGYQPGVGISPSGLRRLTIDLQAPSGSELGPECWEELVEDPDSHGRFFEFPAVHPERKGQPYRFVFSSCATRPTNAGNSLAKTDTQERCVVKVWHEPGCLVGEPVFVPAPGGAEDEGVVLSLLSQPDGNAALLVLDAASMEEVARAALPFGIPTGFHGCWVPAA